MASTYQNNCVQITVFCIIVKNNINNGDMFVLSQRENKERTFSQTCNQEYI